jgi:DNA helicase-2/ATP-dependent DNA helicase PcrA
MLNNNKEFSSRDKLVEYFYEGMEKEKGQFTKEEFERRKIQGYKVLTQYYDKNIQSWQLNPYVVVELNLEGITPKGIPISGKIDKIVFPNKGRECYVYDYKTGNPKNAEKKINKPSDKEPYGGEYWRQMVFYRILLDSYREKNWKMIKGIFSFVEKEPTTSSFLEKEIGIYDDDVLFVNNLIYEVYMKIKNHEFYQGCGDSSCIWCKFVKENYKSEIFEYDTEV